MGEYRESEWYGNPSKWMGTVRYKPPWPKLHWWVFRYRMMCDWTPPNTSNILDLGCGNGLFPAMLKDRNAYRGDYLGIDFSEQSIALARKGNHERGGYERAKFEVGDISDVGALITKLLLDGHRPFDLIVCAETLEHVQDDLSVIRSVPRGIPFMITVPQFDAPAHVRCFPGWKHVMERWGKLLSFEKHQLMFTTWRPRGMGCWIMLGERI